MRSSGRSRRSGWSVAMRVARWCFKRLNSIVVLQKNTGEFYWLLRQDLPTRLPCKSNIGNERKVMAGRNMGEYYDAPNASQFPLPCHYFLYSFRRETFVVPLGYTLQPSASNAVLEETSTTFWRRSGSAFSVRVVKYCNKLPASVTMAPSDNMFKKVWRKSGEKYFPISPIDRTLISLIHLHTTHCQSRSLHVIKLSVVTSGSFWATPYHYES